jgi:hypothetical protein
MLRARRFSHRVPPPAHLPAQAQRPNGILSVLAPSAQPPRLVLVNPKNGPSDAHNMTTISFLCQLRPPPTFSYIYIIHHGEKKATAGKLLARAG